MTALQLAIIDIGTLLESTALNYINIVGLVKTGLLPSTCRWPFYCHNIFASSHTSHTIQGFSHIVVQCYLGYKYLSQSSCV